jgi:hypothetical protein
VYAWTYLWFRVSQAVLWQLTRYSIAVPAGGRPPCDRSARKGECVAAPRCHMVRPAMRLSSMATQPYASEVRRKFKRAKAILRNRAAQLSGRGVMSPKTWFRDIIPPRQNSVCVIAPIASAIADRANFFTWPCWLSWPTRDLSRLRHEVMEIARCSTPRREHLGTLEHSRSGIRGAGGKSRHRAFSIADPLRVSPTAYCLLPTAYCPLSPQTHPLDAQPRPLKMADSLTRKRAAPGAAIPG